MTTWRNAGGSHETAAKPTAQVGAYAKAVGLADLSDVDLPTGQQVGCRPQVGKEVAARLKEVATRDHEVRAERGEVAADREGQG